MPPRATTLKIVLATGAALSGMPAMAATSPWHLLAPIPGGNLESLVFDTKHPGVALAGSSGGIIYRSADGGANWTPVRVGTAADEFRSLGLSPVAGTSDAYAVSDNRISATGGTVFASHDDGLTWAALPNQPSAIAPYGALYPSRGIVVDTTGKSIVFTDIAQGVFRSTDGGVTWSNPLPYQPNPGLHGLALDPSAPGTIWVSGKTAVTTGSTSVVYPAAYKSTDFGATWTVHTITNVPVGVTNSEGTAVGVQPGSGLLFLNWANNAALGGGVFRSGNGGTSWTSLSKALPADFNGTNGSTGIPFDPGKPATIVLGDNGILGTHGLVLSANNGTSWSDIGDRIPTSIAFTTASRPATAGYPAALFAGWPGLFASADHGGTWSASQAGIANGQLSVFADDALAAGGYYGCGDDGLLHSTNGGKAWSRIGTWPGIQACLSLAVDNLAAPHSVYASNGLTIFRSDNAGSTWVSAGPTLPAGQQLALIYADPARSGRLFAFSTATTPTLYISSDKGATWTSSSFGNAGDTFNGALAIARNKPGLLYAGLTSGLWRSTNAGVTWALAAAQPPIAISRLAVAAAAPYLLVVAGSDMNGGAVVTSADGGATYQPTTGYVFSGSGFPSSISVPPAGSVIIITDADGTLHLSKTGGTSWVSETLPTQYLSGVYFYASATRGGVTLSDYSGAVISAAFSGL